MRTLKLVSILVAAFIVIMIVAVTPTLAQDECVRGPQVQQDQGMLHDGRPITIRTTAVNAGCARGSVTHGHETGSGYSAVWVNTPNVSVSTTFGEMTPGRGVCHRMVRRGNYTQHGDCPS